MMPVLSCHHCFHSHSERAMVVVVVDADVVVLARSTTTILMLSRRKCGCCRNRPRSMMMRHDVVPSLLLLHRWIPSYRNISTQFALRLLTRNTVIPLSPSRGIPVRFLGPLCRLVFRGTFRTSTYLSIKVKGSEVLDFCDTSIPTANNNNSINNNNKHHLCPIILAYFVTTTTTNTSFHHCFFSIEIR